jgi:hypothetical protein
MCLSCNVNKPKATAKLSKKKAEANIILIVFYGVLCDIHTYTVAVTQHESGTRNNYIFVNDHIKQ